MGALDGRTAIVTGAGRGIGAAIAVALDAAGARVALVARSADQLAATAAGLANDPVVDPADLGTPDGPGAAVAAALDAFGGRVDVLVNNAGIGAAQGQRDADRRRARPGVERQRPLGAAGHRRRAAGDARAPAPARSCRSARSAACAARPAGRSTRRARPPSTA